LKRKYWAFRYPFFAIQVNIAPGLAERVALAVLLARELWIGFQLVKPTYSSFRRRPESMLLKTLDPGLRRDDGKGIDQRFLRA